MSFSALDSALTGPLFATAEMRAVFSDRARIGAMLRVEAALARAAARFDLAPEGLAAAIEAIAAGSLDLEKLGAETAVAGVPVIPFVRAVQARLAKDLEPAFHKGATTQDVLDSALVLQMRDALALIASDLRAAIPALAALAREHRATPCVGRTYGQHAAPITFGFKAAAWLTGLADAGAHGRSRRMALDPHRRARQNGDGRGASCLDRGRGGGGAPRAGPRRLLGHAAQAQPGLLDDHPRRPCRRERTCRHLA